MARKKKAQVSVLNIIILVASILAGATGGFYIGANTNAKACESRLAMVGAPPQVTGWFCSGRMPQGN